MELEKGYPPSRFELFLTDCRLALRRLWWRFLGY